MSKYEITGGRKLYGEYHVQRAKNSVLALVCAATLVKGQVLLRECPHLADVENLVKIIRKTGARAEWQKEGLLIDASGVYLTVLPEKLCKELRASLFLVGPLLARFKTVSYSSPGGCSIGTRPIDIHLDALKALGANIAIRDGWFNFFAPKPVGANVKLKYPSVGATENAIMFATLAEGVTVIENCAKEPEIVDLQNFLNACGARIVGAGTSIIKIDGVKKLVGGVEFMPMFDRIEAGSVLLTVLSTGGKVAVKGAIAENIYALVQKISNNACKLDISDDRIYIEASGEATSFGEVVTAPYPNFATDLHPQLAACAAAAAGRTEIIETVFDKRFDYCNALRRFGADVAVYGNRAVINGKRLFGANAAATDLRGGMALVIAALKAEGRSYISDVHVIERGYERLHEKLALLGAEIKKK